MNISAVIVTRGDCDLAPCFAPYRQPGITELVVWDNTLRQNLAVYGRYAAIDEASGDVIIVQDDDVILDVESVRSLIDAYTPGAVVANMPQQFRHDFYQDHCLVGFGAIFDQHLPSAAFDRFFQFDAEHSHRPWVRDDLFGGVDPYRQWEFYRTCDIVFTALTPRAFVDVPYTSRDFASDANRMWKQAAHFGERTRMLELARQVRDA